MRAQWLVVTVPDPSLRGSPFKLCSSFSDSFRHSSSLWDFCSFSFRYTWEPSREGTPALHHDYPADQLAGAAPGSARRTEKAGSLTDRETAAANGPCSPATRTGEAGKRSQGAGDEVGWAPNSLSNHTDWSVCCRLSSEYKTRKILKKKRERKKGRGRKGGGRLLEIKSLRKLRAKKCIWAKGAS